MRILLDAMGGDNAPDATIKGAVKAVNKVKAEVILVGQEEVIRSKFKEFYGKEMEERHPHRLPTLRANCCLAERHHWVSVCQ